MEGDEEDAMSEGKKGNGGDSGEAAAPMAPFDLWTQWLRSTMGDMTVTPVATVPAGRVSSAPATRTPSSGVGCCTYVPRPVEANRFPRNTFLVRPTARASAKVKGRPARSSGTFVGRTGPL